jgi:hypothetical protein
MIVADAFAAQVQVPDENLQCGCSVRNTKSDNCLSCPHLREWMRLHECDALVPPEEDFTANPRNKARAITPVSWTLKAFDEVPKNGKTEKELAPVLGCSWQAIRKARYKGHGVIRGWLLAGYVRPDKRSNGSRRRWIWLPVNDASS